MALNIRNPEAEKLAAELARQTGESKTEAVTSVLLAIFQQEPERRSYIEALEAADSLRMSIASFVEISIVIESRYGAAGLRDLNRFLTRAGIELIPVDAEQGQVARSVCSRFGKGRHRATLNYGDCFAYAVAIALGEPLLFKGDDSTHTDVPVFGIGR